MLEWPKIVIIAEQDFFQKTGNSTIPLCSNCYLLQNSPVDILSIPFLEGTEQFQKWAYMQNNEISEFLK